MGNYFFRGQNGSPNLSNLSQSTDIGLRGWIFASHVDLILFGLCPNSIPTRFFLSEKFLPRKKGKKEE